MVEDNETIDDFLKRIGVEAETPTSQPSRQIKVRTMFEKTGSADNPYVLHCFPPDTPPDTVNKASLEKRLQPVQYTFTVQDITKFAEIIEPLLDLGVIVYHRSELLLSPEDTSVSYKLSPQLSDTGGERLFLTTNSLIGALYNRTMGDLTKLQ